MVAAALRNRIEELQSSNRKRLKTMLPVLFGLFLLGALLLGLLQLLRLGLGRKRIAV